MIIDHNHSDYRKKYNTLSPDGKHNGAFYYSKEIVKNIIPYINTDRNWVTIKVGELAMDHSIIFIHNNLRPDHYDFLKNYNDLVLVCGVPETVDKVKHLGTAIYIPLSVDVDYVSQFKSDVKFGRSCYVGRKSKLHYDGVTITDSVEQLTGLSRPKLLSKMAQYRAVYAVGRTAIEAKILGCKVEPYDPRYPDPDFWKIVDNKEAAQILQEKLDLIDG